MMDFEHIKSVIEGLLFVSGDEGIDAKQISEILELDNGTVVDVVEDMKSEFKRGKRGVQIVEIAGFYQMTTLQEHAPYFERLAYSPSSSTLSQAALETLAIIAYKQPITRAELEEVRGVKCEKAITTLINKNLIKEVGRAEGTGRAILYGSTKEFLEYFGLRHLDELPPLSDEFSLEQIKEDDDLFFSK
jgi:segregation and condensation protein B